VDSFFSPTVSCLASRITSYESGFHLNFIEVDPITGRSNLTPLPSLDLDRLHQWLQMVGADLHKAVSAPFVDKDAADATATHAREFAFASLDFLNDQLTQRHFLLTRFSIADAYLCSVLHRTAPKTIDLSRWPAIEAYYDRMLKRPSVSRAIAEEPVLHEAAVARLRSFRELSYREYA
jgi:glutathione S-transferase